MNEMLKSDPPAQSTLKLVNGYWLIGSVFTLLLVTASMIGSTWPRLSNELKEQVSLVAYGSSIAGSYLSWIVIAIFINYYQRTLPMFSRNQRFWWLIHGILSIAVGALHLVLDTFLLWIALDRNFSFQAAYIEKILRWLPFEILAYWACLGVFAAMSKRHDFFGNTKKNSRYATRLSVRVEEEIEFLDVAGIEWIESCDNYVVIWRNGKSFMLKDTMNHLESILDPSLFLRLHRSIIVNILKVKKIRKMENGNSVVELHNGKRLPVSRRRQGNINQTLKAVSSSNQS